MNTKWMVPSVLLTTATCGVATAQPQPNRLPTTTLDAVNLRFYYLKDIFDGAGNLQSELQRTGRSRNAWTYLGLEVVGSAQRLILFPYYATEFARQIRDGTFLDRDTLEWWSREFIPTAEWWFPAPPDPIFYPASLGSGLPPQGTRPLFIKDSDGVYKWVDGHYNPATKTFEAIPRPSSSPPASPPDLKWSNSIWTPKLTKQQVVGNYSAEMAGAIISMVIRSDGTLTIDSSASGSTGSSKTGQWELREGKLVVTGADGSQPPIEAYNGAIVVIGQRENKDRKSNRVSWQRTYTTFIKDSRAAEGSSREDALCGVYSGSIMGVGIHLIMNRQPQTFSITTFGVVFDQVASQRAVGTWTLSASGSVQMNGGGDDGKIAHRNGVFYLPIDDGQGGELPLAKQN